MAFQRNRKAMGGRTGQAGGCDKLAECGRAGLECVENLYGLVEHAHPGVDFIVFRSGLIGALRRGRSVILLRFGHGDARVRRSHKTDYAISHIEMQNARDVVLRYCGSFQSAVGNRTSGKSLQWQGLRARRQRAVRHVSHIPAYCVYNPTQNP